MKKFPLMRNNIQREDLDLVIEHLKQDDPILTNGPKVREFEAKWSEWLGVKYSVLVNSGASANLVSMSILRQQFPQGGEVIVPTLTWVSDISSVLQNGFKPVFVDIDPKHLGMSLEEIKSKVTENTRAVFITYVQGFNALSDELITFLDENEIVLIEDVCESHGASFQGQKLGSFGWMSNFSFYYAHHMSTIEGGMVCTDDENVYQMARMLRSHGMVREMNDESMRQDWIEANPGVHPDFIFTMPAYNLRNNELGAIMGMNQLKRLDDNIQKRNDNHVYFLSKLNADLYRTDFDLEGASNYAFNLVLREADEDRVQKLMALMDANNIEYRRGSAGGGNQTRQPYLRPIVGEKAHEAFPEVEHIHWYGFYLGNYPDLSLNEIDELVDILNRLD